MSDQFAKTTRWQVTGIVDETRLDMHRTTTLSLHVGDWIDVRPSSKYRMNDGKCFNEGKIVEFANMGITGIKIKIKIEARYADRRRKSAEARNYGEQWIDATDIVGRWG
jgi:hypothetical protein